MAVYFVRAKNYVKIGYSSDPRKRIAQLQTSIPYHLEILTIMPGNAATEQEFHSVFSDLHHLNEWYHYEGELKTFINVVADVFVDYTMQHEGRGEYQNERDWEYWKAKAESAEEKLKELLTMPEIEQLPGDFRLLTGEQKERIALMDTSEIARMFGVSPSTARRWKRNVTANGSVNNREELSDG